jgi:hypothetical protein
MSYSLLEIKRGAELPMSFPTLPVIFSEAALEIEGDASCGNASAAFQSSMQSMWHHWNTNTEATFSA